MNDKIRQTLSSASNDNREITRRRFPRRLTDVCVLAVNGTTYPVQDWSQCGVLFEADGRTFEIGATMAVTMRFKRTDVVTDIELKSRVVRAGKNKVALEFVNVPKKIQETFSKIIEEASTRRSDSETQLA